MIYEKIKLKDYFPAINSDATITAYCISNHNEYPYNAKRKTVLIIPGGGYEFVSFREAEPIAIKYLSHNYNAFVLNYSIGNFIYPYPLVEAFAAIAYIRMFASKYNVDLDYVGVVGFSAGGHLAASISNYYKESFYSKYIQVNPSQLKIDFTILSYPVISMDDGITHESTKKLITQNKEELLDYFSIDKHVNTYFPPTFIWATKKDTIVPYVNSVLIKEALDKKGIKNELHLFENGDHGGATCDDLSCDERFAKELKDASHWIDMSVLFINSLKK